MRLCKINIPNIKAKPLLVLPGQDVFELPEKVVQFGTGALLRGLPDFIIIDTSSEKVKGMLSCAVKDTGVVIAPSIKKFRELKLRPLSGTHAFGRGIAYLAGFATVKPAMNNPEFYSYRYQLMYKEIVPVSCSARISKQDAETFAGKVLDRFKNCFIEHKWLSIAVEYSSKMNARNAAVIQQYERLFKVVPESMALGMAAHIYL